LHGSALSEAQINFQVEEGIETAVFILCTSYRTEFWVIQQNRKYLQSRRDRLPSWEANRSDTRSDIIYSQAWSRLPTSGPTLPDYLELVLWRRRSLAILLCNPDPRSIMGNGASSQGSLPSHDRRNVGTSIVKEQHDWQEQAVAPRQETISLPDGRKPYIIYMYLLLFVIIMGNW